MSLPELIANTNGPITELASAVNAGATVLPVTKPAPAVLQGAGQFRCVIGSEEAGEIVLVTGGAAGTDWTVERGQEGTAALEHVPGAPVYHELTAGGLAAATTSPAAVEGEITAERTRAETAEGVIATALTAETGRAEAAETANATAISNETTRAEAAEAAEATRAKTAETTNATAITAETTRATAAEALKAPLASPVLTGDPTAPTAPAGTNTTQIATTAFARTAAGEVAAAAAAEDAAERTRAEAAEATNAAAITGEITRAKTAEKAEREAAEAASSQGLVPTTVKSAGYEAKPGDYIPIDISAGSVAIALPNAPADKTRVGMKIVKVPGTPGEHTATVNRAGTDVFNVAGGSTTLTLSAKFQSILLQYQHATGIWYVQTTDTPLNEALGAALLGSDGTIGGASGSPLAATVMNTTLKEHGETEGEQTPNLEEGHIHRYVAKGAITIKKPSHFAAGASWGVIWVIEDAVGGRAITTEGFNWPEGEPAWNTAANAINSFVWETTDGGLTVVASRTQRGAAGATGPEGFWPDKLTLPTKVKTYKNAANNEIEERNALVESIRRSLASKTVTLTSGTPQIAAIAAPPKKKIEALGFYIQALEATPANRTHLWVALLNAAGEVIRKGVDYTSAVNNPLSATKLWALRLSEAYESGNEGELLYAVICETMSSTNPLTIGVAEGTQALLEATPVLGATGPVGQTTPAAFAGVQALTASKFVPYAVLL